MRSTVTEASGPAGSRMRILALANDIPSPAATGLRMRLFNALRALTDLGDVDFVAVVDPDDTGPEPMPPELDIPRHLCVTRPPLASGSSDHASQELPRDFARRDYSLVRAAFRRWEAGPYDLVWYGRMEPYVALSPLLQGPAILDMDDLEDRKIRGGRRAESSGLLRSDSAGAGPDLEVVGPDEHEAEAERWTALQRDAAGKVDRVLLCSELDQRRFDASNVVVIPNGYENPAPPRGRVRVSGTPTILFAGYLRYEPNVDAVRVLVDQVLPRLRSRFPGVGVRLVGRHDERVGCLADRPGVVVTGPVPDMAAELERADLVAVPLRIGSGTRIKIVEAFAHCIPVVTTTLGCEGLGASHGQHLLVSDTVTGFVSACHRALREESLRERLTRAGNRLYLERYESSLIRARISALVRDIVGRSPDGSTSAFTGPRSGAGAPG